MAARRSSIAMRPSRLATRRTSTPRSARFSHGIEVGGIFLGGGDDVVAGLPGQALGDDADALAGVLDEGDVERVGVEEQGGEAAHLLDAAAASGESWTTPFSARSAAHSARAVWARPVSGATAAWSKYAQRRATGISARKAVQSMRGIVRVHVGMGERRV